MKLTIPLAAPSLNQWYAGNHWAKRKKVRDEWHEAVWLAVKQGKTKPIKTFPVHITTQSFYKKERAFDASNTFPANKLCEDGLVAAGILPDDTIQYVSGHTILCPQFSQVDDKTVVTIEVIGSATKTSPRGL